MKMLGDIIKSYREEHQLSLRDFAEKCGFSHAYVDKLEKGVDPKSKKEVIPTIDTLQKVAGAMNITLGDLLSKMDYIQYAKNKELLDDNQIDIQNTIIKAVQNIDKSANFEKSFEIARGLIQALIDDDIISKGKPIDDSTMEIIKAAFKEDAKRSNNLKK